VLDVDDDDDDVVCVAPLLLGRHAQRSDPRSGRGKAPTESGRPGLAPGRSNRLKLRDSVNKSLTKVGTRRE
jgi:hypothetical protein